MPATTATILLLATLLCAETTGAQSKLSVPAGQHHYVVTGSMNGDAMDPWTSRLSVSDTTRDNQSLVNIHYDSRESPSGFLYAYSAAMNVDATRVRAEWIGNGHVPSTCALQLERGNITGRVNESVVPTPKSVTGSAVPDFAIGAYLSTRPLAAGDTIRFTMFRCLAHRGLGAIDIVPAVGTLVDSVATRAASSASEPVWSVSGSASYPFAAVIAKRDRMVLRTRTPQGTVGYSTDTLDDKP